MSLSLSLYIYIYICMYAYTYIYIYIHTCIHLASQARTARGWGTSAATRSCCREIGKLISPTPLTEEIMHTQFYDKVDEYNTLDYTNNSYKQEELKETTYNNVNDIDINY